MPVLQAVETAPSNPAATEAGGSQTNSLGKSVSTSPAEHLRTQIEEFVAQLLGRPCPVIATVREVAQKVRRKLDTRKQEGGDKAAEELMYSCNIAFVLAAHVAKVGVSKQGAAGAQREESAERDLPTNGWAGSSDTESGERDRPSLAASSPEAIAEAVAAGLRTGGSAGADWRAEACRGHLNFYAPAERLRGEEAGAADETRSAGQTTANPASMSGRKHPGEQGRPGSEAEGQPKRRKRFEMRMSRAKFDKEVGKRGDDMRLDLRGLSD